MTNQELNNKIKKQFIISGLLIFCSVCAITLFASSHQFVNTQTTPKWLGMLVVIGIAAIVWNIGFWKKYFYTNHFLLLSLFVFLFVFIRSWGTFGFKPTLLMFMSGMVLLFILLQYFVSECPSCYFYGAIIIFGVALSLQGILQYIGVISSGSKNFAVTGNFDNPAGYVAGVSCAFPFCFFFLARQKKHIRWGAIGIAVLMMVVVVLSGSRSGVMAMVVTTTVWFFVKSKKWKITNLIIYKILIVILIPIMLFLPIILYFIKKDSADGRLLIWRCTLDMVLEKPITGHGTGAFNAKYMLYQAEYFNTHPDSQYARLAGNTLHPFNEYLLVLCEYGLVGLAILALSCCLLFRAYRRHPSKDKSIALMCLLVLAVFSLFSYPFRYPFTWVIFFLSIAVICNPSIKTPPLSILGCRSHISNLAARIVGILLSTGLMVYSMTMFIIEIKWSRIAHSSISGHGREVFSEYNQLYRWLGKDGLFLYNFAAELHEAGEFEKSLIVFEHCTRYFNDMDVQMLLAINYKQLGKFADAEKHFKLATAMVPSKFVPMYELVKLYMANNREDDALALAKKIIHKEEKVISPRVVEIKKQMRQLIQALEKSDNLEKNHKMGDESINKNKLWRSEMPEIQFRAEALPP